ncbi:Pyruvate/2-oxoglutarate dehydrogenase complex, dihydrolipoamide dehydrogenase (E3) component [Burkholderia sp. YR290]|jgi:pyruvate/2-oxoglutarate dehydrogenase complex dihydrolipoamide dehydrogenase (E3) component|uniref:FAD-dependent oxidoreductase n=1 Tax=Paraburkholderia hospita TaxID=169430 RepID=UPI0009A5EE34|nr:FAD-dependent oxidoreductase [Paraburkholderia hospita]SKD01797.1 Pyruvate/2-oxoglutarate dehydrogenase complex, dihydrolipoamide dehydrogenase (E3) component [Paraburkholderia hospita]SOE83852.1 Pyruvate/2-oxoglutarate dehydrogenase complex, dihydrolipoamide dehydrogenase (E3) component [Burkholderia sp. YR290]
MSQVEHFDTLILGSGQGGKLLAWHLGRAGQRVAVVERQWVGGSCPAVACLPSKNEIWSARVAHLARHAADFGTTTGPVTVDMAKVRERKRGMIEREAAFHVQAYASSGAELIMGVGRFVGPKTIEVQLNDGGTRTLSGEQVVVNVGTHAAIPDLPGLRAAEPLTHIGALDLDYAPAHLIVLGGGYIGIEMAQAYRRFGSRVTIIERGARLMAREDADVSEEMLGILRAEGIDVVLNAETTSVKGRSGKHVRIVLRTTSGEQAIDGSDILIAAGRVPNTADIGLEQAGIELDDRGYIRVNERLQASAAGVWAIGEVAGSPQFTHVSVDDFRIVRDNMAGGDRKTSDRLVPYTLFTDPPLARVGLNESDALRHGIAARVAILPMSHVLRTEATDETQGFMKVLVGAKDDRIVGFTMIGPEAGEVMASMQTAMLAELPYQKLRDAVISHLTFAEGLGPLLSNVPARAAE